MSKKFDLKNAFKKLSSLNIREAVKGLFGKNKKETDFRNRNDRNKANFKAFVLKECLGGNHK